MVVGAGRDVVWHLHPPTRPQGLRDSGEETGTSAVSQGMVGWLPQDGAQNTEMVVVLVVVVVIMVVIMIIITAITMIMHDCEECGAEEGIEGESENCCRSMYSTCTELYIQYTPRTVCTVHTVQYGTIDTEADSR